MPRGRIPEHEIPHRFFAKIQPDWSMAEMFDSSEPTRPAIIRSRDVGLLLETIDQTNRMYAREDKLIHG